MTMPRRIAPYRLKFKADGSSYRQDCRGAPWQQMAPPRPVGHLNQVLDAAQRLYVKDSECNIQIDANPEISVADHGTWVQAWLWVPNEQLRP